jgi:phosphatidate cytidylyltransferase
MLAQRLLVAAIGIPVLLLILVAGNPWLPLLLVVLVTAAAVETANLLSKAGFSVHPIVGGALGLLIALAAASTLYGHNLLPAAVVIALVASAAYALAPLDPADRLRRLAGTILTSVIALALSTMILIVLAYGAADSVGPLGDWLDRGQAMLLVVVLTVWACDTAAYATGRLFPRGHFFAHISPHKTWSGAIGGFVGATVVGYLLGLLVIQAPAKGLLIGLAVGLLSPIGDLTESTLKRAAGAKDSSRIFPGHGGILDRMDSFITVAPVVWLLLAYFGLDF